MGVMLYLFNTRALLKLLKVENIVLARTFVALKAVSRWLFGAGTCGAGYNLHWKQVIISKLVVMGRILCKSDKAYNRVNC